MSNLQTLCFTCNQQKIDNIDTQVPATFSALG
ncbi:hypothetical protein [Nostoc sp.]